jgi:glucokinase
VMKRSSKRTDTVYTLDLGGTNIRAGVVNRGGDILCRVRAATPPERRYEAVLNALEAVLDDLESACRPNVPGTPVGISVGVPGIVDPVTGDVEGGFNVFGAARPRVSLKRDLESRRGLEVRVDRDVNLAALGEHRFGAGRGYSNLVCVFVGTGVGAGLIFDGALYRGAIGAAGELGHITIERDGAPCRCGNHGCLELEASGQAIAASLQSRRLATATDSHREVLAGTPSGAVTAWDAFELASGGDRLAAEVIERACSSLGIGVATLVTLLNPQRVILGGGVARRLDQIIGPITAEIRRRCRSAVVEAVEVVGSELWDDAGILGGARLFFDY